MGFFALLSVNIHLRYKTAKLLDLACLPQASTSKRLMLTYPIANPTCGYLLDDAHRVSLNAIQSIKPASVAAADCLDLNRPAVPFPHRYHWPE